MQLAKRLDAFLDRIDDVDINRVANGRGFTTQDLKKKDFVNAKGELHCADDRVLELIDALEGRFFDDGFTTEKAPRRPVPQAPVTDTPTTTGCTPPRSSRWGA